MLEILSTVAGICGALGTEWLKGRQQKAALEEQTKALEIQERIGATELEKIRISTNAQTELERAKLAAETDKEIALQGSKDFTASLGHDVEVGKESGLSGFIRKTVRPWITLQWNFIAGWIILCSLNTILQNKELIELIINGFVSLWLTTSTWWFTNRMIDVRRGGK